MWVQLLPESQIRAAAAAALRCGPVQRLQLRAAHQQGHAHPAGGGGGLLPHRALSGQRALQRERRPPPPLVCPPNGVWGSPGPMFQGL